MSAFRECSSLGPPLYRLSRLSANVCLGIRWRRAPRFATDATCIDLTGCGADRSFGVAADLSLRSGLATMLLHSDLSFSLTLVGLYWPTLVATVGAWSRNPLGQGYIVVPGALWLAWRRRKELALSVRNQLSGPCHYWRIVVSLAAGTIDEYRRRSAVLPRWDRHLFDRRNCGAGGCPHAAVPSGFLVVCAPGRRPIDSFPSGLHRESWP